MLKQIRMLSNGETDTEKLLQIVLVGQLNLQSLLRSPEMRQLDQRVSIRYQLRPLTLDETASYVVHRLTIAGGGSAVSFTPKAVQRVNRLTAGIPRLINLLCDRALLAGFSARTNRIGPDLVDNAARTLDLEPPREPGAAWVRRRAAAIAAGALALAIGTAAAAYGAAYLQARDVELPEVGVPRAFQARQ